MDLKDFVSGAIVAIAQGIIEARRTLKKNADAKGVRAAPPIVMAGGENAQADKDTGKVTPPSCRAWAPLGAGCCCFMVSAKIWKRTPIRRNGECG